MSDNKRLNQELLNLNREYLDLLSSREYRTGERLLKAVAALKHGDWKAFFIGLEHFRADKKIDKLREKNENWLTERATICDEPKIAVYTCIAGEYDELKEPVFLSDNMDLYVVTDLPVAENSVWKRIPLSDWSGCCGSGNTRKARFIKTHPHLLFPDYEYSIWVDSNLRIVGDISEYPGYLGRIPVAVNWHPFRNCIYKEARACILKKKEDPDVLNRQILTYRKEGMPENFGLIETSMLVRKHHDPVCRKLMDDWWREIEEKSLRDQVSFPYIIWKSGYTMKDIGFIGTDIREDPTFQVSLHKAAYRSRTE